MKLLLDTHVALGAGGASHRLPAKIVEVLLDEANTLYVSSISIWEIVSKHHLGKLPLAAPQSEWMRNVLRDLDASVLPFQASHALGLTALPLLHRDPFDRMLICQARAEGLTLLTSDDAIRRYDVPTLW